LREVETRQVQPHFYGRLHQAETVCDANPTLQHPHGTPNVCMTKAVVDNIGQGNQRVLRMTAKISVAERSYKGAEKLPSFFS